MELKISEDLSLIHDPSVRSGKTMDMAKGLFLRCGDRLCAGESAGMGLPVVKTGHQIVFPSLVTINAVHKNALEMEYSLDRVVVWHCAGNKVPAWFSRFMERIVDEYMKRPGLQHQLLKLRTMILSSLSLRSEMVEGDHMGNCRVAYVATPQGLTINVYGRALAGQAQLLMLNEVDGQSFNRFRIGDAILQDRQIPAWKRVSFDTIIEGPLLNVGVSISPGQGEDPSSYAVFCGREVAPGLDWAGLALTNRQKGYTYLVYINHF